MIQQQHLIELIRRQEIVNALDYAQNHVSERAEDGDEVSTAPNSTFASMDSCMNITKSFVAGYPVRAGENSGLVSIR